MAKVALHILQLPFDERKSRKAFPFGCEPKYICIFIPQIVESIIEGAELGNKSMRRIQTYTQGDLLELYN